jgi:adenylate cyclase
VVSSISSFEHQRKHIAALGDAVNVAARLQDLTKSLGCCVIVSDEVYRHAGIGQGRLAPTEAPIRGRERPVQIYALTDPSLLTGMLDEQAERPDLKHRVGSYDAA